MHEHTTHFNDCGCLSARKDAEIAALLARVAELEEKLRLANIDAANETARANYATAERDRLREALEAVALSPRPICTGEHDGPCDCVGDRVRAALEPR